jgi:hypothetical protein
MFLAQMGNAGETTQATFHRLAQVVNWKIFSRRDQFWQRRRPV